MKETLIILIFISLLASCKPNNISVPTPNTDNSVRLSTEPNNKGNRFAGFPAYPPIADADPVIRTSREFEIPTSLKIERTANQLFVSIDMNSLKKRYLNVGKNMVTGFEDNIIIYRGNEVLSSGRWGYSSGNRPAIATDIFNRSQNKIPNPGEEYRIEVNFNIFETDIPPQHMWMPKGGKYRVIGSVTLSAISK